MTTRKDSVPPSGQETTARRGLTIVGAAILTLTAMVGVTQLPRVLEGQPASTETAQMARDEALATYTLFAGTVEQRNAGYVLRAYAQNHAMDECLAKEGFPEWDWSLSRQYAGPVDPLSAGVWLSEPGRGWRSEALIAQRSRLFAEDRMNDEYTTDAQDGLIGKCLNSTPWPSEEEVEHLTRPSDATFLMEAWHEEIGAYASAENDLTEYESCMESAGLSVLEKSALPASELSRAMSALDPPNEVIPPSEDDPAAEDPVWQAFLAAEQEVTDADWACREDVYRERIAGVASVVDSFMAEHADRIEGAQAGWQTIEAEARRVGFTGRPGPLGQ